MKMPYTPTIEDLELRAGGRRQLAALLGITTQAIFAWKGEVPELRMFQLKKLKPDWFEKKPSRKAK